MIHVVVVAYRSSAYIRDCLEPLLRDARVESLIVIDNSADSATEAACEPWVRNPRFEYVANSNVGYAAACNLGFARRPGKPAFVAYVNPDVVLIRPLSELAKLAEQATGTVFSAHLEQGLGTNHRPMVSLQRELLSAVAGSRAYGLQGVESGSDARFIDVPQIDGSLLLVPMTEAERLGGFDERFELYYEDVDYCRRANDRLGCKLWSETWGSHKAGSSFAMGGDSPFVVLRVSRLRYLQKWFGLRGLLLGLAIGLIETIVRSATGYAPSRRALGRSLTAQFREVFCAGRSSYLS